MTALRQEAFRMLEAMPEEGVAALIQYMLRYNQQYLGANERIARKKAALDDILSLSKQVSDFDEMKELQESREERFSRCEY
jgi:hypothetical protein